MLQLWIFVGRSSLVDSPHCGFLLFQRGNEVFVSPSHLHSESHHRATARLDLLQVCCCSCCSLCTSCCLVIPMPRTPTANLSVCRGSDSSRARIVFNRTGDAGNCWRAGPRCYDFPACCRISQLAVCNNQ